MLYKIIGAPAFRLSMSGLVHGLKKLHAYFLALAVLCLSSALANPATKYTEFLAAQEVGEPALELLDAALEDPNQRGANDVLRAAILRGCPEMRDRVAEASAELPLASQLVIHGAFSDRGDARLEAELISLFTSGKDELQPLLLPFFMGSGTQASLPILLDAFEAGDARFANDVASVILRMSLSDFDQELERRLTQDQGQALKQAITLASIRNPLGTEAALIELLLAADGTEHQEALLAALERIGTADTARVLLHLIGRSENPASARPFQAVFRRIGPRFISEVPSVWEDAFIPAWNDTREESIRVGLLLMIPALRGAESGAFLVELIHQDTLRGRALAQLRSWNQWAAGEYILAAAALEGLTEGERRAVFQMGTELLTRRTEIDPEEREAFAHRLISMAPDAEIRASVEAALAGESR